MGLPGAVVRIAGMPNGVDELSTRPQHPADLGNDCMNFAGGQRHTQRHVCKGAVNGTGFDGQRLAQIVHNRLHPRGDPARLGTSAKLRDGNVAEIGGHHREALASEIQGVTPMTGRQLQHPLHAVGIEHLGGIYPRL
ncbi:Uncharacterised protein [Mycobacterium tuberculosis]|nr:hypothetical protein IU12_23005 [Mycobacterium tuberculosis]CNL99888.1 Uncharacterised protein [Mycobacterium tuberculosis]CNM56185.1 Uncharacterised protein [Mycobacterium tuberculosis]CNN39130.1 Uncharacterised protein [Mycobacterium tuberculosis]